MTYSISTTFEPSTSADPPSGPAGRDVYYHTFLHKRYASSTDYNPLLKFVWQIYTDIAKTGLYENDWAEWVDSVKSVTQEGSPSELENLQKDRTFVIDRAQFHVITHEREEELFTHDRRVTGVSGDWKKIRQLYKKLKSR